MKVKIGLSITVVVLAVVCIWLATRGTKPTQQMPTEVDIEKTSVSQDSGVSIRRVGVFDDDIATGGKRGIYRVHDSVTGEDYLGVSGINLSPSHPRVEGDPIPTP